MTWFAAPGDPRGECFPPAPGLSRWIPNDGLRADVPRPRLAVRDYQGRRHTVTVAPEGYVWEGQPYSSLSAIARAITGTAWSGPRFFALKSTAEQRAHDSGAGRHHPQAPSSAGASRSRPGNPTGASARPNPTDPQE
jgi:hypothetical protein